MSLASIAIRNTANPNLQDSNALYQPQGADELERESEISSSPTSSASYPEIPDPTYTLEEAIESSTSDRVKAVLAKMCRDNIICRALESKELLIDDTRDDKVAAGKSTGDTGSKRRRKAVEICQQCEKEYDVVENDICGKSEGLCKYHPGERELDTSLDLWADHDPDCHGDYDLFEDDSTYAEGFVWSCCEGLGNVPGCCTTKHRPDKAAAAAKRTRLI